MHPEVNDRLAIVTEVLGDLSEQPSQTPAMDVVCMRCAVYTAGGQVHKPQHALNMCKDGGYRLWFRVYLSVTPRTSRDVGECMGGP